MVTKERDNLDILLQILQDKHFFNTKILEKEDILSFLSMMFDMFVSHNNLLGIFLYDIKQKKHLWVNDGYLEQYGTKDRNLVIGQDTFLCDNIEPTDLRLIQSFLINDLREKKTLRAHYRKKNSEGQWEWYLATGKLLDSQMDSHDLLIGFTLNLSKEVSINNMWEKLLRENIRLNNKSKTSIITTREKEVLRLFATGLTQKEVANKLDISFYTVETHKKRLFEKLKVNSLQGLVAFAVETGLNQC
jgi:DNA-binding CsgD family transcriptional regulator